MGHDRGAADQVPLRWSEREASEFADLMVQLGAVSPEDATVLLAPGADELREALAALSSRARLSPGRTEVLLYLSGHARSGALSLGGEALPLAELRGLVEELPADVVITLTDACTSATVLRRKGVQAMGGFQLEQRPVEGPEGRVWIASAGPSEPAFESDHSGGSLFARHLFAALRGAGDADGDGLVTVSEAWSFLYGRTLADSLEQAGAAQHPHLETSVMGPGELVLTSPGRDTARLALPDELVGAELWVVDDARGRAVVELGEVAAGTSLALYPGTFTVYSRRDGRARVATVQLRAGQRQVLSSDGRLAALRPVRTRGGGVLPRRWELGGSAQVRGPLSKGGGAMFGGGVALDGQLTRFLRVGGAFSVLGGRLQAQREAIGQLELGLDGGAWFSPAGLVQPLIGGRLGVLGVVQRPAATEPSWYSVGGGSSPGRGAVAPSLMLETGLLVRIGAVLVTRFAVQGGLVVLQTEAGVAPRFRWGGSLTVSGLP